MPILPRRDFLVGALGAAACAATGREGFAATAGARRIDVHHHYSPPAYLAYTRSHQAPAGSRIGGTTTGSAYPGWNLEADLADMDASGVQTAMLSMTTPGFGFGERDEVRSVSRVCNEYAARLKSDHPGRFGSFAMIPLTDTEGSLREIEYAFGTLKADGIGLMTSYGDKWLGHPSFLPVMEELNRRKAIVYTHPTAANCCVNLVRTQQPVMIEFGTDTTRTIADVVFSGNAQKFRDIKWIFSHAGGTMPFLIERFVRNPLLNPGVKPTVPEGTLAELKRFYYDTAQTSNKASMSALSAIIPVSQILFGTDFPYRTSIDHVKGLREAGVFSDADIMEIERGNALKLLPRLAA